MTAVLNPKLPGINKDGKSIRRRGMRRRRNSSFWSFDHLVFELKDYGMVINVKKRFGEDKKIEILKNINAIVNGGEVMAIMGPSGAGKTSLLESATLNQPSNATITGTVTLNNMPLTRDLFQRHCYIVNQIDYLATRFTCRETLVFAAKNCIGDTKLIHTLIDELIQRLGLKECENVRVGDENNPGLSGGQKRRLSVCLALIKRPRVLFLDEPTSGLDTTSAYKTCLCIKEVAHTHNLAAFMTIHQPNTKIYNTFHKLMLLSKGELVYFGPSAAAENFFAKLGCMLPDKTNISDYMLDVLEARSFDVGALKTVEDRFGHLKQDRLKLRNKNISTLECRPKPNLGRQILTNLHKQGVCIKRDPLLYSSRFFSFIISSTFFGLVYISSRKRNQAQVLPRLWLHLWFVGVPTMKSAVVIFGHSTEIIEFSRSVHNGIMHPLPFFVARLLQIPMMMLLSIASITTGGYVMCNWAPKGYVSMILIHAMILTCNEFTAELCAAVVSNAPVGVLIFLGTWFMNFLFSGMLVQDKDVVWPIKIYCYLLPHRYALHSMVYTEFTGTTFEGTYPCNATTEESMCYPGGFACPTRVCFGRTGSQVLDSLHNTFTLLTSENKMLEYLWYMTIYIVSVKVLYIWCILRNLK